MAGKVKRVERSSSSALDALHFGYGASGHRIMKQVTDDPDLGEGYREHYIRDAQCLSRPSGSNIMATYHYSNPAGPGVSLRVKEWPIYGSSRVGQYIRGTDMYGEDLLTPPTEYVVVTEPMHPGHTHYELNDHLGNVSAVVTGQLLPGGAASAWQPRLLSAQGYEPFGALLPGRKFDVLQAIPILKLHRMLLVGETVEVDLGGTIVTLANYNAGYTTIGEYLVDIQSALSTNGITGAIANGAIQIGNWPAATDLTSPSELASLTTTSSYRFGFQGQEKDDEIHGASGTSINYKYRMHDPRIGRFLSLDPLAPKYPHNSPYAFSENRVIDGVELEGLEYAPHDYSAYNWSLLRPELKVAHAQFLAQEATDKVINNGVSISAPVHQGVGDAPVFYGGEADGAFGVVAPLSGEGDSEIRGQQILIFDRQDLTPGDLGSTVMHEYNAHYMENILDQIPDISDPIQWEEIPNPMYNPEYPQSGPPTVRAYVSRKTIDGLQEEINGHTLQKELHETGTLPMSDGKKHRNDENLNMYKEVLKERLDA